MLEPEADHRRHAEIENAIRDLEVRRRADYHMPSGRFAANGAWLAVQVMAHNLARWTARLVGLVLNWSQRPPKPSGGGSLRSGEALDHPQTARRLTLHLPQHWPWETVHSRHGPTASHSTPRLTASLQLTQLPRKLVPPRSVDEFPAAYSLAITAHRSSRRGPVGALCWRLKTVRRPPIYPNGAQPSPL